MKYIGGVDVGTFKWVKIKRLSNNKWYDWDVLLKQIKRHLDDSDRCKLKWQFIAEYNEIKRTYDFFWLSIDKKLIYKPVIV